RAAAAFEITDVAHFEHEMIRLSLEPVIRLRSDLGQLLDGIPEIFAIAGIHEDTPADAALCLALPAGAARRRFLAPCHGGTDAHELLGIPQLVERVAGDVSRFFSHRHRRKNLAAKCCAAVRAYDKIRPRYNADCV